MPNYDIWTEGYRATGDVGYAFCLGSKAGATFKEACAKFMKEFDPGGKYYNKETNCYWGCELFDNGTDARKSFG